MVRNILLWLGITVGLIGCQSQGDAPTSTAVLADGASREQEAQPQTPAPADDTLEIVAITPETVIEGEPVRLRVTVKYALNTRPEGEISIGFNTDQPGEFRTVLTSEPIAAGAGEIVLETDVTPVLWADPDDFSANVALSEHPHPSSWQPLQSVTRVIQVEPYLYAPYVPGESARANQIPKLNTYTLPESVCYAGSGSAELYCVAYR